MGGRAKAAVVMIDIQNIRYNVLYNIIHWRAVIQFPDHTVGIGG